MWWSYSNWHSSDVEAAVECADQIKTRWEDKGDVISRFHFTLLGQEVGYPFRLLVEFKARQYFGGRSLAVQQCEEHVVGSALGPPSKDLRNELLLLEKWG